MANKTVRELIEFLRECDPEDFVTAYDGEGGLWLQVIDHDYGSNSTVENAAINVNLQEAK